MTMHHRLGLVEGAGLTDAEIAAVLAATQAGSITERIEGRFYDVSLDASVLVREPTDEGVVDLVARLFDEPAGGVSADEASRAELCVLVPGCKNRDFVVARSVEGAPGWAFKDLDVAHAELKGAAEDLGHPPDPHTLSHLRRASSLGVVVVFGERRGR